jgi:hypothetical protein
MVALILNVLKKGEGLNEHNKKTSRKFRNKRYFYRVHGLYSIFGNQSSGDGSPVVYGCKSQRH